MADVEVQETRGGCIRAKIAIPQEILDRYNPEDGDELEVTVKDGYIYVESVAVYPDEVVSRWEKEAKEVEAEIASGKRKPFTNVDDLINDMEARCQEVEADVCA